MTRRLPMALAFAVSLTLASRAAQAQQVNHPAGFTGQTDLTFNQNASVTSGGNAQLTPAAADNRGSFFSTVQLPIGSFNTTFTFHELGAVGGMADGIGFCIQRAGPTAVGNVGGGSGMGYQGILTSIFVKFDNFNNESSTGLYQNGADPQPASIDMRAVGVDVHSQHDFLVNLNYNGVDLVLSVTDLTTMAVFNHTFAGIDIPTIIGGTTAHVGFTGATGGSVANQEVVNWTYSTLPVPTNVMQTSGYNQVTITWTAVAGATGYNILRSGTSGGSAADPYVIVGTATPGTATTFTDTTVTFPNTYFYVVQTVQNAITSGYSSQVIGTPLQPPITITSTPPLVTTEVGGTATFNVVFVFPNTTATTTVTVTSNAPGEGRVSTTDVDAVPQTPVPATSLTFTVPANTTPSIQIVVTGRPDGIDDGNRAYTVTVSTTSTAQGFTQLMTVNLSNTGIDTAGVTVTPSVGGFIVNEQGATTDSFTIQLNSIPIAAVTFAITSTPTPVAPSASVTIMTPLVTFQPDVSALNPQTVTVQAIDDLAIELTQLYTIVISPATSTDPLYTGMNPPDVTVTVMDDEAIPPLARVWGCGLMGLEWILPLGLAAFWRRRRRNV